MTLVRWIVSFSLLLLIIIYIAGVCDRPADTRISTEDSGSTTPQRNNGSCWIVLWDRHSVRCDPEQKQGTPREARIVTNPNRLHLSLLLRRRMVRPQ